jgi:hypothetical protein
MAGEAKPLACVRCGQLADAPAAVCRGCAELERDARGEQLGLLEVAPTSTLDWPAPAHVPGQLSL